MSRDFFAQRKKAVLSKGDKSFKRCWDRKILSLCNKINLLEHYYTTSSCSGRMLLMIYQENKQSDLFCKVYHGPISFFTFKREIKRVCEKYPNKNIKFKVDPSILHIACKSMDDAKILYEKAKISGWKKLGLISWGKRIVLEIVGTGKLELPLIEKGKLLVNDEFLKILLEQSSFKLKNSWKIIKKLENCL